MKEVGFEPTTHGLKGRCDEIANDSLDNDLQPKLADTNIYSAKTPAKILSENPDLAGLVEAWPRLPEHIRLAILSLTKTC